MSFIVNGSLFTEFLQVVYFMIKAGGLLLLPCGAPPFTWLAIWTNGQYELWPFVFGFLPIKLSMNCVFLGHQFSAFHEEVYCGWLRKYAFLKSKKYSYYSKRIIKVSILTNIVIGLSAFWINSFDIDLWRVWVYSVHL